MSTLWLDGLRFRLGLSETGSYRLNTQYEGLCLNPMLNYESHMAYEEVQVRKAAKLCTNLPLTTSDRSSKL